MTQPLPTRKKADKTQTSDLARSLAKAPLRGWRRAPSPRGVIIVGPPGAGKSTLTAALARQDWFQPVAHYVERAEANPFLQGQITHFADRQWWFIRQYEIWLANSPAGTSLVVDQDPRAVVMVYSKLFNEHGLINDATYQAQLRRCIRIAAALDGRARRWSIVILHAPRDVLMRRLRRRPYAPFVGGRAMTELFDRFDAFVHQLKRMHKEQWLEFDTQLPTAELVLRLRGALAKTIS